MKIDDSSDNYINIGYIVSPHGIKGELKVKILTDNLERFREKEVVYLIKEKDIHKNRIISVKWQGNFVILLLDEIESRNQAEELRNFFVSIEKGKLKKLPEGSFYYFEIIGLDIYTIDGIFVGKITDIFRTGSNDVYVAKNGQKEILIPATKEIVKNIDLPNKRIIIDPLTGLLDIR